MSRVYRVPINQWAMASSQEVFELTAAAGIPCWLEEIRLDPFQTSVAEFLMSLSLFTGSFTAGSGGTSVTPTPTLPNDVAASATFKFGNTTRTAVGSGTKVQKDAGQINSVNGWYWQPIDTLHRIAIPASACLALSLDTTAVTATINGCVIFSEMF